MDAKTSDDEFAAKVQAVKENVAVRRADEHERANRDSWWLDEGHMTESGSAPLANTSDARKNARSTEEEEQILSDSIVGMKATTEGTAGRDGADPPVGHKARTGEDQ